MNIFFFINNLRPKFWSKIDFFLEAAILSKKIILFIPSINYKIIHLFNEIRLIFLF